jgi:iron complex outermembrane receptor protein
LDQGFATLNLSSTFNQNNVSGSKQVQMVIHLVNLGFGGKVTVGKTIFNVNLNGNNLLDKRYIAHLST